MEHRLLHHEAPSSIAAFSNGPKSINLWTWILVPCMATSRSHTIHTSASCRRPQERHKYREKTPSCSGSIKRDEIVRLLVKKIFPMPWTTWQFNFAKTQREFKFTFKLTLLRTVARSWVCRLSPNINEIFSTQETS